MADTITRSLTDAAQQAHEAREAAERARRKEVEAERTARLAREADEAMDAARAVFVSRVRATAEQARDLVHVTHSRSRGVIQHVIVAVPVEGLGPKAITLIVNWPTGKPQVSVCEHRGGSWGSPSYGKRIESLADLGQVIADRREARYRLRPQVEA